jgi:hypothetical protein
VYFSMLFIRSLIFSVSGSSSSTGGRTRHKDEIVLNKKL